MEWSDDAIVLAARRYGDSAAILEALTRGHGRHLGLVRGGASRRLRSFLLPGNTLSVVWRARLAEHLGGFTVELHTERAGTLLERREALIGLNAFAEIARAVLPEREPHESLFQAAEILLDAIATGEFAHWDRFTRAGSRVSSMLSVSDSISRSAPPRAQRRIFATFRRNLVARCRAKRARHIEAACSNYRPFLPIEEAVRQLRQRPRRRCG